MIGSAAWTPGAVTVLVGDEEFFKRDLVARVLAEVFADCRPQDAFSERDAKTVDDVAAALIDLRTPSFFSPTRVVWLRQGEKALGFAPEALLAALQEGFPCGRLVIDFTSLDGRTRFAKTAAESGAAIACRKLWDTPPAWKARAAPHETELHQWVLIHARRHGLKLTPALAGELVALTGNAPGVIDQELRKLAERVGVDRTPTSAQIQALVPDTRHDSVFALVDHALLGKPAEALASLRRLLRTGYIMQGKLLIEPAAIAAMCVGALASRLRALRRAARLARGHRVDPAELAAAGLVPRGQAATAAAQYARLHGAPLARAFELLLDADRRLKGKDGRADPATQLELLFLAVSR